MELEMTQRNKEIEFKFWDPEDPDQEEIR